MAMSENGAAKPVQGFIVGNGELQQATVVHGPAVIDCLQVPSGDHSDCWHQKHAGRFRDNCLTCDRLCEAFPVKERPYFAGLLELRLGGDTTDVLRESEPALRALRKLYARIPATTCERCGQCCRLYIVEAFSIEYLLMWQYLRERCSPDELKRFRGLAGMNVALERKGLIDRRRCPFQDAESGRCLVHPVKPLACRLFLCDKITWSRSGFEAKSRGLYGEVVSLCEPCFIVDAQEVIVTKVNELNRWFIL
jgi:Fe-S-cluster containining protein